MSIRCLKMKTASGGKDHVHFDPPADRNIAKRRECAPSGARCRTLTDRLYRALRYSSMASRPAHFQGLLRFLRRKGRSQEDAEDLIQEAMLRLHVYAQDAPVANKEAFLRRAVHNLSIDLHRRDRLDLHREVRIEDLDGHVSLIASEVTPEDTIEAQQRLNHIGALLDAVSIRTREIYFAHRAGYSYAEIADHMDISRVTIKRHIARALLAIMEHGEPD
jgi:RNA polymerase sigma factor (sigma-70 family)